MAATLALVGMLLGAAWQAAQPPAPASPRGEVGLPDRIYVPSRWLRTADGGELGRLVALRAQGRGGWWGERPGVVGLSALTGEYAFLDLPDLADEDVALSPDGRYVAYRSAGVPSGSPNTTFYDRPITGVSVYDADADEVRHAEFPTDHGLGVDGALFFVDGDTLVLSFGQILAGDDGPEMDQSTVRGEPVHVWRLSQQAPVEAGLDSRIDPGTTSTAVRDGRFLATPYLVDLNVVPTDVRRVRARSQGLSAGAPTAALSPDGGRLARLGGPGLLDKAPNRLSVSSLSPRAERSGVQPERVLKGSAGSFGVVSWLDDDHLAVLQVADRRAAASRSGRWTWPRARQRPWSSSPASPTGLPGGPSRPTS